MYSYLYENVEVEQVSTGNWAKEIKSLLDHCGFSDVWQSQQVLNSDVFLKNIFDRLCDQAKAACMEDIKTHSKLTSYCQYKLVFACEQYLQEIKSVKLRHCIAKLRLASHNLNVEVGRHKNIPKPQRVCTLCQKNEIEDEHHFLFRCPRFSAMREHLIPKLYVDNPNVFNYNNIMKTQNIHV